jgi:hypothetical protein
MVKQDLWFLPFVAREMQGRWKGDGRGMEGRWKGDGRKVVRGS